MTSWFRDQLATARRRNATIPPHARMVITDPTLSTHTNPSRLPVVDATEHTKDVA